MDVIDEEGKSLGKVKVGDTKLQALERLSNVGAGGLYDKDDIGLLDTDLITAEGAPYVFKAQQPQQQQDGKLRRCSRIVEFITAMAAITPVSIYFPNELSFLFSSESLPHPEAKGDLYQKHFLLQQ